MEEIREENDILRADLKAMTGASITFQENCEEV
jgi:hypothetical protein